MTSFHKFLFFAFIAAVISQSFANHPRDISKRATSSASLSHDKYQAVLKVYTEEGPLEDKNRKADEVAQNYSESEKKVVEAIKKFFGKRAEVISKLSDETKGILKEIKDLRQKQKALFEKINNDDKKSANFLLFGQAPQNLNGRSSSSSSSSSSL